jgi:hypothetical protein
MSIQAPQGILNIPNAILRVGKLSVDEVVGADTILNTVARNTILLVDDEAYHENKNWALKLPNAWAGEFECNTASAGNYSEFNFYNEGASSNVQGYNLTFNDTAVELRYDGTLLKTGTLASTITGTGVKKVRLMFERTILSVTVDGTLVFTHDDTIGPRPRVYSTTAGGFLNFFTNGGALKNLKIVNEKWMSDGTSNIAYVGGGEVAVGQALAFNRVSNVSQIKVDSNVVTEYTGPHDRPLRKYPEVALTADAETASGYKGYKVTASVDNTNTFLNKWRIFNGLTGNEGWVTNGSLYDSGNDFEYISGGTSTLGGVSGEWVKLELPTKIRLSRIVMTARNLSAEQHPEDFQILGSNDDSNWTQVMNVVGAPFTQGSTLTFNVTGNVEHFKYLAVIVTRTVGWSAAAISELEYYGYEEGSGSLDTTLKSVYNVPATTGTQLEVYYDAKDLADGAVTSVTDLSPNSNGGLPSDSPQVSNGAFVFDGVNDYIYNSQSGYTASDAYTASVWVKFLPDAGSSIDPCIFQFGNGSNHSSFGMISDSSENKLRAFIFGNNAVDLIERVDNVWYHLCATYYASNGRTDFFINGILKESVTSGTAMTIPSTPYLSIGVQTDSSNAPISATYFTGSIANFRLYSKALNADQVKELYDYQKDYFLGSKSQVTLYKGHLGVGVTEPSGQLELAGDERIQEYPPRALTGYETLVEGHGVFCASASSYYNYITHLPWQAFTPASTTIIDGWNSGDNSTGTDLGYYAETSSGEATSAAALFEGTRGEWVQLKCPYPIIVKKFAITGRSNGVYGGSPEDQPKSGILYGSNDGNNWDILANFSGLTYGGVSGGAGTTGGTELVEVNATKGYTRLVLQATARVTNFGTDDWINIGQLQYFGTPGPTTLDKGSLSLGRSLDVPRISRYDVDTETPRPEKLVLDFDTTVNSSPTDISGKGNHGAFYNGASYSPADKAFDTPNATGILVRGSTLGSGAQPLTLCAWAKGLGDWNETANDTIIAVGPNSSTGHSSFQLCVNTDAITLDMASASNFLEFPTTITNGRWYFIAMTYTGGDAFTNTRVYVDGVEIAKPASWTNGTSATLSLPSNPDIGVGTRTGNGSGTTPAGYLAGMVSNPKIYNVALEPSEVKKLYNLGRTGRSMVISDTAVGIGKVPEAQLDVRGTANFGSRVGIGTTDPACPFHVKFSTDAARNSGNRFEDASSTNYWENWINSLDYFYFAYNGSDRGWIQGPGGPAATKMPNFTGQHMTFIKDIPFTRATECEGLIVSSDQNKYIKMNEGIENGSNAITINECLPVVSLSNVTNDKKCFGVISASEDPETRTVLYGAWGSVAEKEKGDTRVYINSVGEGAIWVTNINGSLESGDYITTSNVAGYGQKQDGAGLMNYTVAKITMDCDFNPETQPIQIIKRDETGENILDEHGQIQWEDHPTETEKAYKIRYLDANGNITDEANHVYKAAFVGCTYHCG